MDALKRINSICLTLTVGIFAIATPFIESLSHFPWLPQTLSKSLAAFIASVGGFSIVVKALPALADNWKPLKKFFIGPTYVEGTWIGFYKTKDDQVRYVVEMFEQDDFNVNLRGFAYDASGKIVDKWQAPIVHVDPGLGTLRYLYTSGPENDKEGEHYGIANYQFVRKNISTPPHAFDGTVIDSGRAITNHITLTKLSDTQANLNDGLTHAIKFYNEQSEILLPNEAFKAKRL